MENINQVIDLALKLAKENHKAETLEIESAYITIKSRAQRYLFDKDQTKAVSELRETLANYKNSVNPVFESVFNSFASRI